MKKQHTFSQEDLESLKKAFSFVRRAFDLWTRATKKYSESIEKERQRILKEVENPNTRTCTPLALFRKI